MTIDGWRQVGTAWIVEKATGNPTEAIIEKEKTLDKQKIFRAILKRSKGKAILGELSLDRLRIRRNGEYGSQFTDGWQSVLMPHLNNYGPADNDDNARSSLYSSKILVSFLEAEGNILYRGIGTALMQVAIETSFCTRCDGRLVLSAIEGSSGFYHRLGLRSWQATTLLSQEKDEMIVLGKSPSTDMYLPQEAIELWKDRIHKSPILNRTRNKITRATLS